MTNDRKRLDRVECNLYNILWGIYKDCENQDEGVKHVERVLGEEYRLIYQELWGGQEHV